MDVKLVLSIVVAGGMVVAAVFERRANKARARAAETAPYAHPYADHARRAGLHRQ
jgi:hypothetical protein